MEIKAQAKFVRMSPRKMRLVADLIRGLDAEEAANQLKFLTKAATRPISKLLNSAVANAVNNFKLQKDNLYIKNIIVNEGPTLKRWQPRAFGRATPIRKRSSHVLIVLAERIESKKGAAIKKDILEKPRMIENLKDISKMHREVRGEAESEKKTEEKKLEKVEAAPKALKKSKGFLKKLFSRKTG